ncbi:hypothetical protein [Halothermothrix orenii]|uniref:Uncharacterized protein n=1 Tax=Halothermothrix orenii (strain H 168 / OCM 544 / DSM 9562) TaxID=373903 RepID=B8CXJ8_HALOH|nr:hypothetical protein [Halothermothrix orenii]ACL70017.1 hypothetical protein Hore_12670 [Halothermothrix orenii H 168]
MFLKIGKHVRVIKTRDIEIKKGDFLYSTVKDKGVIIKPNRINIKLHGGQRKTMVFKLKNNLAAQVLLNCKNPDLKPWIDIINNNIRLSGYQKGRLLVAFKVPRNNDKDRLQGNLIFTVYKEEKVIKKKEIPVSIRVIK